ncbi:11547_t:CDS:2 [Paraglomus brasilianum]|uniref:Long-chain-fatty-acid--CoA ligase n=1 Tax=Paraglomus brasilianum TaxID=144538 RepID=A0A9N9FFS6_9GLOM|nr:11547_t:CDS:2 [Paraglomus brasilianum]
MTTQYSVEVANAPTIPGEGKPRRNALLPDRLISHPPGVTTLWENFLRGVRLSEGGNFLGTRRIEDGVAKEYVWQTYPEVQKRIQNLGSGLRKLGLQPYKPLGFFLINCAEWTIAEIACYQYSFITVPLYDTLGVDAIEYIINQTEMEYIVASQNKVQIILDNKQRLPHLKHIVVTDGIPDGMIDAAAKVNLQLHEFTQVEKNGATDVCDAVHPKPEDIAIICYTSGTTGTPKGAILTHSNLAATVGGMVYLADKKSMFIPTKDDIHISYLPLAHVMERCDEVVVIYSGGKIGYYQGDTLKLLDDIAELKPTVFVSVPRLFNRVYDKVMAGVKAKGGIAQTLFHMAYNQKKALLSRGIINHWLWDRIVFAPIRARLGGRVKNMLSGSAPIQADVLDFLKICFSANVYEGYGSTENTAGASITVYGDMSSGHVGAPQLCNEIKLVDVPSMDYTSQDKPFPRGEICVRGNAVFKGYYKLPEKTEEALDKDGWFHTGDIGMWDDQGHLKIIDRVKNIFKLAQGEYIAPEKIEIVYQKHELVAQAFVHGESLQASLVGIIVPDEEQLLIWAKKNGHEGKSFEELCKSPEVNTYILQALTKFGKQNDLKGFENVKKIYLCSEPFSVQNDLFTPTFKLKRHQAKQRFQSQINAMYAELQ